MTVVLTVSPILFGLLSYMLLPLNDLPAVDYSVIQMNCCYASASQQTVAAKSAIRIKADPSALAARGMTMDDLAAAIRTGTTYQGAGQFDGATRSFLLQPQGQLVSAEDYNNLILATRNGSPVYLKDVAAAT